MAVTEPDFGSDVAGIKVTATKVDGGWLVNGVKTWCTFGARATVLMLLARTDPDRSKTHRGLSMFVVPKPVADGHGFEFAQEAGADGGAPGGGKMEGRPIDTIGYRGMHSYEIALDGLVRHRRQPRRAARTGWARASTSRWPASRTGGCRPRPAPSA